MPAGILMEKSDGFISLKEKKVSAKLQLTGRKTLEMTFKLDIIFMQPKVVMNCS